MQTLAEQGLKSARRLLETRLSKKDPVLDQNFKNLGLFRKKFKILGLFWFFLKAKNRPWLVAYTRTPDIRKSPTPPLPQGMWGQTYDSQLSYKWLLW